MIRLSVSLGRETLNRSANDEEVSRTADTLHSENREYMVLVSLQRLFIPSEVPTVK